MDTHVEEVQLNYMLLLWRRGKIFDEQFCTEIAKRLWDKTTVKWIVLLFRKTNRLPVDPA